jgi:hypothetical protein
MQGKIHRGRARMVWVFIALDVEALVPTQDYPDQSLDEAVAHEYVRTLHVNVHLWGTK